MKDLKATELLKILSRKLPATKIAKVKEALTYCKPVVKNENEMFTIEDLVIAADALQEGFEVLADLIIFDEFN